MCSNLYYFQFLRLPLCFKSSVSGQEHDHIVLAVNDGIKWGALGISRLKNLMDKDIKFGSLFCLVMEFIGCYKDYRHVVSRVSVGLPFDHDDSSETTLQWKLLHIVLDDRIDLEQALERYARDCKYIFDYYSRTGGLPDWCTADYLQGVAITTNKKTAYHSYHSFNIIVVIFFLYND